MPPHKQEPPESAEPHKALWPSDDSDMRGDGGKTAQLPVPEEAEGQQTAHLPRPTRSPELPTVWVQHPARPASSPEAAPPRTGKGHVEGPQPAGQAPRPRLQQRPPTPPVWSQRAAPPPQPQPVPPPQPPSQPAPPRQVPPASAAYAEPMRLEPTGGSKAAEQLPATYQAPPETPSLWRRRRGLIFGGVAVLLVVVAVGVAAAVPYVSNRLGLPWAPNAPKGDSPRPPAVNLALKAPDPLAPTPTSSGVAAALAGPSGNPVLSTLTGAVIDPATGSTLWDHSSGQPLTPASTTKLLTTSAALLALDHGMQLTTKVVQGSSPNTVILFAGGDATLSSLPDGHESIYAGAAHLDDLVAQVKRAVGGSVRKVQIDLSLFDGGQTGPGWASDDAPSTYAAPITPGMLDAGMTDPSNEHSPRIGDPAGTLLGEFARRLGATPAGTTTAPKTAKVLGEVHSAPLTELIDTTLVLSDDTLAEMIARQTAIATGLPATFDGAAQATTKVLSENGFDITGMQLRDASGLSTLNKVPARLLAQLLGAAAAPDGKDQRTAKLRPLLEGLPVAGGSGTLADRYHDAASAAGKGWVRAKTGTLTGVNTLAGVVLDSDGRVLSFALMSNGSSTASAQPALDAVTAALRGCGCR